MKKNIFVKGALGLLVAGTLASCSSDYLELDPLAIVSTSTIAENTTQGQYAVNGIVRNFNFYRYSDSREGYGYPGGVAGEAYFMTMFGDMYGQDYFSLHMGIFQYYKMVKMEMLSNSRWYNSTYSWAFYYGIIGQANRILAIADEMTEDQVGERNLIKAECLAFRAHCYVRLLQIFGPRWSDSNNGENKCIVLRVDNSTGDTPLVSMNDVLTQIYKDCDDAIAYFQESDVAAIPRLNAGMPDLTVTYGLKARAALLKNDWQTAHDCAKLAQTGHGTMTNAQWCAGFMDANNSSEDYMWTNSVDEQDIMTNLSWSAYNACNGLYENYWKRGPATINIDLVRELDPKDIRLTRFLIPSNLSRPEKEWYDSAAVDMTSMIIFPAGIGSKRLRIAASNYAESCTPAAPSFAAEVFPAFQDIQGKNNECYYNFGGQMKFYCAGGSDQLAQFPLMRATEMLLTQAEAAYELGLTSEAQELVGKLAKMRIDGYTNCDLTGTALRDFIRLQRRIELWGEGVTWFDFKRWELHNVRRGWVVNDITSGNVPADCAMDVAPTGGNHWIFSLPYTEYDYNKGINMSDLQWIQQLPK